MPKPRVFKGPAAAFDNTWTRTLEFSNGGRGGTLLGGLIRFMEPEPGRLIVELDCVENGVEVRLPPIVDGRVQNKD